MNARVLTMPGNEFALGDPELRNYLCYLEDGTLLVAKSHTFNPHVRAFIARLGRMGRQCNVINADLDVIAEKYADAQKASEVGGKSTGYTASQMQKGASDLFQKAVEVRASDIHIRVSKRARTRIFFRVHNDIEFAHENTYEFGEQLCSTIYQAMADVADATFETISRQDARISDKAKLPAKIDGIRIATSPQVDGFIMVLRLLYNDAVDSTDLRQLGFSAEQNDVVQFMKRRPSGINIIGGPTGSGKSTTLQRVLTSIHKDYQGRKHIITVEDPPEYPILGAVQTPVTNADTEEERSRAFQAAIKAAMRLDPDVIMIGEVRDPPSARLAIQAAMTGHQVWATVHANNALAIIDRLVDLGVPSEMVCDPSIISGLVCQRLVKTLCPHCSKPMAEHIDRYRQADINRIASVVMLDKVRVRGDGCPSCRNTGVDGRTVVTETVVTDETLMSFMRKHDRIGALNYWRNEQQGVSMLMHAIQKIGEGLVDPFMAEDVVGPLNIGRIEQDFRITPLEVVSAA